MIKRSIPVKSVLILFLIFTLTQAQTNPTNNNRSRAKRRATEKVDSTAKQVLPAASTTPVTGSGTAGQITKWAGFNGTSFTVGDSTITDDKNGNVGIGTTAPTSKLTVAGTIETSLGGYKFPDGTFQTTAARGTITSMTAGAGLFGGGNTGDLTLGIAPLGVMNSMLANGSVTGSKIANGAVVRSFNGLFDNVSLLAGTNITITPSGNSLTIAASSTSVSHDDTLSGNGTSSSPLKVAAPLSLTASNAGAVITATNQGSGNGFRGNASGSGAGVFGSNTGAGSALYGVAFGNGPGVTGVSTSRSGVEGTSVSGYGVQGTSDSSDGVHGVTTSDSANGVAGIRFGLGDGVLGQNIGLFGNGVKGISASGTGVRAESITGEAIFARSDSGDAVTGTSNTGVGIFATGDPAGFFSGDVEVLGNLTKGGGSFKIDHPLDPEKKYLYHSFVESPDMMNIYNGNIITDANGDAVVALPNYFLALNKDFRYQLTVVGQFAQAIVASEVEDSHFTIKTDKPNVKVSWQVTGVRHDAWANAHRIKVEEEKSEKESGHYLHPELYGQPEEKSTAWARRPELMQRMKQDREQMTLKRKSVQSNQ